MCERTLQLGEGPEPPGEELLLRTLALLDTVSPQLFHQGPKILLRQEKDEEPPHGEIERIPGGRVQPAMVSILRSSPAESVNRSDPDLSFSDCRSAAIMNRLGIEEEFAFDSDFRGFGFTVLPGHR